MPDDDTCEDINLLARFLAHEQVTDLHSHAPVDCIVLCVSAVLFQAEELFRILESRPSLTKTLVLVGGIGHSTQLVYDAVARDKKYAELAGGIKGLPESRVAERILQRHFDVEKITSKGCQILVEDKSTNCGSNAIETRKVLQDANLEGLKTCIIVQDPTMSLRTLASFEKAYEDSHTPPNFLACPFFVPNVSGTWPHLGFAVSGLPPSSLWTPNRFHELLLGEIPRLADNETGYGPRGKGFITHVDVSSEVDQAWNRLSHVLQVHQR